MFAAKFAPLYAFVLAAATTAQAQNAFLSSIVADLQSRFHERFPTASFSLPEATGTAFSFPAVPSITGRPYPIPFPKLEGFAKRQEDDGGYVGPGFVPFPGFGSDTTTVFTATPTFTESTSTFTEPTTTFTDPAVTETDTFTDESTSTSDGVVTTFTTTTTVTTTTEQPTQTSVGPQKRQIRGSLNFGEDEDAGDDQYVGPGFVPFPGFESATTSIVVPTPTFTTSTFSAPTFTSPTFTPPTPPTFTNDPTTFTTDSETATTTTSTTSTITPTPTATTTVTVTEVSTVTEPAPTQ